MATIEAPLMPSGAGTFTADVFDNTGLQPANIVEADLAFHVKGDIILVANDLIAGTMKVTVFADEIGGDIDREIGHTLVPVNGDGTYPYDVTVAAATLPDPATLPPLAPGTTRSGTYQVAAVCTHETCGVPPKLTEIQAFEDLGAYRVA